MSAFWNGGTRPGHSTQSGLLSMPVAALVASVVVAVATVVLPPASGWQCGYKCGLSWPQVRTVVYHVGAFVFWASRLGYIAG